jgi:hypothetical protein
MKPSCPFVGNWTICFMQTSTRGQMIGWTRWLGRSINIKLGGKRGLGVWHFAFDGWSRLMDNNKVLLKLKSSAIELYDRMDCTPASWSVGTVFECSTVDRISWKSLPWVSLVPAGKFLGSRLPLIRPCRLLFVIISSSFQFINHNSDSPRLLHFQYTEFQTYAILTL